jgi:hypothetical protein
VGSQSFILAGFRKISTGGCDHRAFSFLPPPVSVPLARRERGGGLFIPDFSLPDSILSDEVIVEVQVVPELRKHAGTALAKELGVFLSQQPDPSFSSVVPMRREVPY